MKTDKDYCIKCGTELIDGIICPNCGYFKNNNYKSKLNKLANKLGDDYVQSLSKLTPSQIYQKAIELNQNSFGNKSFYELLEIASDMGSEEASCLLGCAYILDENIGIDVDKGLKYLELAASNGSLDAMYFLGVYLSGEAAHYNFSLIGLFDEEKYKLGIIKYQNGVNYLIKAAKLGHVGSITCLKHLTFKENLNEESIKYIDSLDNEVDVKTMVFNGSSYTRTKPKSNIVPNEYEHRFAEYGNSNSQEKLGNYYFKNQNMNKQLNGIS